MQAQVNARAWASGTWGAGLPGERAQTPPQAVRTGSQGAGRGGGPGRGPRGWQQAAAIQPSLGPSGQSLSRLPGEALQAAGHRGAHSSLSHSGAQRPGSSAPTCPDASPSVGLRLARPPSLCWAPAVAAWSGQCGRGRPLLGWPDALHPWGRAPGGGPVRSYRNSGESSSADSFELLVLFCKKLSSELDKSPPISREFPKVTYLSAQVQSPTGGSCCRPLPWGNAAAPRL